MLLQRIFIFWSKRKWYFAVVIEHFLVFSRTRILYVKIFIKRRSLMISKTKSSVFSCIQQKVTISFVRSWRWYSLSIDNINFISIAKSCWPWFHRSFLDVVERSLASEYKKSYGDSVVLSNLYDFENEYKFFDMLVLIGDLNTFS